MRTTLGSALLVVGVAMLGCSPADSDSPTAPRGAAVASAASPASAHLQQQVTGHANIELPVFGNAVERYSNSAIRHSDGTVTGQFELRSEQGDGLRLHGDVVCFTIVGNRARLAGQVQRSNTPLAPVGS